MGVITGHHDHPQTGLMAARHCLLHIGTRRVHQPDQAAQLQFLFGNLRIDRQLAPLGPQQIVRRYYAALAAYQLVLYAIASLTGAGSKYSRLEGVDSGFLFSGEVYEEYEKACKSSRKRARSSRWYKEYLNDLEMLGLIVTTPSGKGVRGQTTLIRLGPNPESLMIILKRNLFGE